MGVQAANGPDEEATCDRLHRDYWRLLNSLDYTHGMVERGWKHLKMAEIAAQLEGPEVATWHLSTALRIARSAHHAEMLSRVRECRNGMTPRIGARWAHALDQLLKHELA